MDRKTAIIDGVTSFIGLSLIRELRRHSYTIYAIVRPDSSRRYLVDGLVDSDVHVIECSLSRLNALCSFLPPDVGTLDEYYHIGWSSDFDNPRYNLDGQVENVRYTLDAMRVAHDLGCKRFIGVGSQAECGLVDYPINSDTPDQPITAYAQAKCETYRRGCELSDELGISFYWPRLLSAYGLHDHSHTLIMSCIEACTRQSHIPLSAAEQIWDYVYVDDVARALYDIAQCGAPRKRYSIASGVGRPLREYIQIIADVFDYPELLDGLGERPYSESEVMYLVGDVSELCQDTGWRPDTDFEKRIRYMKDELRI